MTIKKRISVIAISTLLLLVVTALKFPIETRAAPIMVSTWDDELNGSPGNGKCSLREAIMNANLGNGNQVDCTPGVVGTDTIYLYGHNYTLTIPGTDDYNYSGDLDITDDLTINGTTSGHPTVIQAGTADPRFGGCSDCIDRVLHITNDSWVYINDVTIRYGNPPDGGPGADGSIGGGILNQGNLELKNCSVLYNKAGDGGVGSGGNGGYGGNGGGILSLKYLKLKNTQVMYNRAGDGGQGDDGYNGGGSGWGGGIYADYDTDLYIEHSTISENAAGNGGRGGDAVGSNAGNGAGGGWGGGINCGYCYLAIDYATVSGNESGVGGDGGDVTSGNGNGGNGGNGGGAAGVLVNGSIGESTLKHTTIDDNHTGQGGNGGAKGVTGTDGSDGYRGEGGGFTMFNATLANSIEASTISHNTASEGAGVLISDGSHFSAINSTISGNEADDNGGGIRISDTNSFAYVRYTTIADNTASSGGGMYISNSGSITVLNTIIYGNLGGTNPDCFGAVTTNGNNLLGVKSKGCAFTPAGGDLVGVDPVLGNLNDNGGPTETHSLKIFSPAVDHITGGTCGTTDKYDQRGVIRYDPCDIGAYEIDQATHIYLPLILR